MLESNSAIYTLKLLRLSYDIIHCNVESLEFNIKATRNWLETSMAGLMVEPLLIHRNSHQ